MLKKLIPVALTALALCAHADEAAVKKAIEAKLGTKVESVSKSGYLGLYEVFADGQIVYTDEKVSALFAGHLIDAKTMKNVTEQRLNKLNAVKFSDLQLDNAIKQVRGNGKRLLATFEDPNCGYCKRLHKEIQKLDNVTIYTFMIPILSEDSLVKAKQIWCASDRAKAWNDFMIDGKAPPSKDDCDTSALNKNFEFARKRRINGTPALFFADGERIPGFLPLARIEEMLNAKTKP